MGAEIDSTGDLRKLLEFSKGQKVRKLGSVVGKQNGGCGTGSSKHGYSAAAPGVRGRLTENDPGK